MKITDDVRQAYRDGQASAFGMLDARILADALRDALAEAMEVRHAKDASAHMHAKDCPGCLMAPSYPGSLQSQVWQQEADRMLRGEIDAD